jgi:phage terminase Nu1 subunit (DNA packaging protein)
MAIVTVEKLAQAMNITPRRVQQLVEEGMPREAHGAYDLGQCMAFYIRYLQNALERRDPQQLDSINAALRTERQRLTRMQADQLELELEETRGRLIPAELFEQRLALMVTSARTRILLLPARIAPELEGLSRDEIKRKLTSAIHQLLTVLAAGPRQLRRRRPAAAPRAQPMNGHTVEAATQPQ